MAKIVDSYLDEDLIIYRGLQSGGAIGRGYRVEMPDTENTEANWMISLEDSMRVLLRGMQSEWRMQVVWSVDSDYRAEIERYHRETKRLGGDQWSVRQREERYRRYDEKIKNRELRREHLSFYLTTKIEGRVVGGNRALYNEFLATAKGEQSEFEEALRGQIVPLGGRVTPMDNMQHLEAFYKFFNPSAFENPNLKLSDVYSPTLSVCEMCFNGDAAPLGMKWSTFRMDGFYQRICVLKTLPNFTYIGMTRLLTNLGILDFQITVNIEPGEVNKERLKAERKLARLMRGNITPSLESTIEKLRTRIHNLNANTVTPYMMHFVIRVWDIDEKECSSKMTAVKNSVLKMGGAQVYEPSLPTSVRNFWQLTMPGWAAANYNDFKLYIEDVNLADLLPISSTPVGDLDIAEAIYDGPRGALIGTTTFVGRKGEKRPEHGIMFGASGSGKSVFTIDLLTQTAPYFDYTAIVEEGLSYNLFTRMYGCEPIIVRPNGDLTFNYFDTRGLALSPEQIGSATSIAQLMAGQTGDVDKDRIRQSVLATMIERIYIDQYETWIAKNYEQKIICARRIACAELWRDRKMPSGTILSEAWIDYRNSRDEHDAEALDIEVMDLDPQITENLNNPERERIMMSMAYTLMTPEDMPTHGQFTELLNLESRQRNASPHVAILHMLLEPWGRDGRYGAILDGVNNVDFSKKVTHFELSYIPESAKDLREIAGFLITNDIRKEIMNRPRSTRKRVILEELSAFLAIPDGERITREYYERMRKYSTWVFSIIQQFGRIKDHPVRGSVVGNSRIMYMLKQTDQRDIESMSEGFRIPAVTRDQVRRFPDPSEAKSDPYGGFVYYHEAADRPIIAVGRHYASKEMVGASATSGEAFEKQNSELKKYKGSALQMIIDQAK